MDKPAVRHLVAGIGPLERMTGDTSDGALLFSLTKAISKSQEKASSGRNLYFKVNRLCVRIFDTPNVFLVAAAARNKTDYKI